METLSSGLTVFIKRVFPIVWLGFIVVFLGLGWSMGAWKRDPISFFFGPIVMILIGLFMFRKLARDIADEVRDGGGFLFVRNGSVEERIPYTNVMNVGFSRYGSPRKLTLRLRTPGKLGDEITFIPKTSFQINPFARNAVAEALIKRVDAARREA